MKKRLLFYLRYITCISALLLAALFLIVLKTDYVPDSYKPEIVIILTIAVIIAAGLIARVFARLAILPYEKFSGTLERALKKGRFNLSEITEYSEFLPLAQSFNALMLRLNRQIDEVSMHLGRIESLISSVEDGIFIIDSNFDIVLYNEKALEFLNISHLNGTKKILHLFRDDKYIELIQNATQKKESASLDIQRRQCYYRMHVSPASDGGAVLLIIDVTKIYKLERSRTDFMENVTHELKTPLTTICGHTELIAEGLVTDIDTIKEHMRVTSSEALRMAGLIEDILRLSEIEHGIIGETEHLDLREIAECAVNSLSEMTALNEVTITVNGHGYIIAQREHIFELFLNLLSNAIRYNKRGGSVTVEIFENATGFSIADTGIGIPREHLDRIFERFYRVDKARSRNTGGTGLGLSIVKHIVELYHGQVSVASSENGTVFKVEFSDK